MSCITVTHRQKAICIPHESFDESVTETTLSIFSSNHNQSRKSGLQQLPFSVLTIEATVVLNCSLVNGNPRSKGTQSLHLRKQCMICGLYSNVGYFVSLEPYTSFTACSKFPQELSSMVIVLLSWLRKIREALSAPKVPWFQSKHRQSAG